MLQKKQLCASDALSPSRGQGAWDPFQAAPPAQAKDSWWWGRRLAAD